MGHSKEVFSISLGSQESVVEDWILFCFFKGGGGKESESLVCSDQQTSGLSLYIP